MKTLSPFIVLSLLALPRFGRKTVRTILSKYCEDSAPSFQFDDLCAYLDAYVPQQEFDRETIDRAVKSAAETLEEAARANVLVLTYFDAAFPSLLRDIPDAPIVLFVKGNVKALEGKASVAVIGTREPTEYGERTAQKLGQRFAERGFVVVSGLAKGCDAFAHEGCVEADGVGIAVLAHGLDTVYPAENRPLAEKLIEKGGCLVSEYPLGVRAHRSHFVERDRLQSGLSRGVVVIETDIKGGTMHTVGFAQEQRRCLACIAHPLKYLDEPKVQGNQYLLKNKGALPLADASDLDRFASALLVDWETVPRQMKAAEAGEKHGQGSFW